MDMIFKALNDPARRKLLDALRIKNGQSLSELEDQLEMTRFGVMKHLRILEQAQLVNSRKIGRFKYHYLNALPLQEVIDRWIDPFLKPQSQALIQMKAKLEGQKMTQKPDFMMSTFIDCSQDALWEALTRGEMVGNYHFICDEVTGTLSAPGDQIDFKLPDGSTMLSNRLIAIDPKSRIEFAFLPNFGEDQAASRCVYLLEPTRAGMRLTVEHYDMTPAMSGYADGWSRYLSGLKTYLETGRSHRFVMEAM